MVRTKGAAAAAENWRNAIGRVPDAYKKGTAAVVDFTSAAVAGQDNYEKQMTNTDVLRRREAGLQKAGDAAWKKGTSEKGAARISQGMTAATQKQASAIQEVISVIEGTTLPARGVDVDTNIERVRVLAKALQAAFKR